VPLATVLLIAAQPASAETASFGFTGTEQTYTVPAGVDSIHVVAVGAKGGRGFNNIGSRVSAGGSGGRIEADLAVTPGQVLFITVGGVGGDGGLTQVGIGGFNGGGRSSSGFMSGGGGGGATDLRTCSALPPACPGQNSLDTRVLVAGGGGGGGGIGLHNLPNGGEGGEGGDAGENGGAGQVIGCDAGEFSGGGGAAASQVSGGTGGVGVGNQAAQGQPGAFGLGGAATTNSAPVVGGGGGGGFFGGGGGGGPSSMLCTGGGGGGGSSFAVRSASNVVFGLEPTAPAGVVIEPSARPVDSPPTTPPSPARPSVTKPSNAFTLGKLTRNPRKGTAILAVEVPGPGTLSLTGKGLVEQQRTASRAGSVSLRIAAKGSFGRKLSSAGQAKLKVRITFTPAGGDPKTLTRTIELIKA
jgi:Glycine rich protein